MKKIYRFFLAIVMVFACVIGFYSFVDKDKEISEAENRGLTQKPAFTFATFFNGEYMESLEDYYADQFPLREAFLAVNAKMNLFYTYTSSSDGGAVVISIENNAGVGGIGSASHDEEDTDTETGTSEATDTKTGTATQEESGTASEETETASAETEKEDPEYDDPDNAQTINSMLYVDGRAMEIVYEDKECEENYADAINNFAELMPDVNVYSIVVPNSTPFYGPAEYRSGSTDEESMINYIYSQLDDGITTVDAYSKLRNHMDEYIYFRTDHHWTQRGAYYAYTAFCEAAGLEAVSLDAYSKTDDEGNPYNGYVTYTKTGADTFLGTLYSNMSQYPVQCAEMEANPDKCEYFYPLQKCNDTAYVGFVDGELVEPREWVTTVARSVGDSYLYMAFISGDQPISIIDTDVDNDRVVMVLKESYGNAFVPFLTNHFSKVVVVDPREFNTSDSYALYLPDLAEYVGATDLIVINYPFMPNNTYYTNRLRMLGGLSALS